MEKFQFPLDEQIKNALALPPVGQIGMVVQDMDKTIRYYTEMFGLGPWTVVTPHLIDKVYRGKPGQFSFQAGFTQLGDLQLELIKVLQGPAVYEDDLGKDGEGLHHLGFFVNNIDARVEAAKKIGLEIVQSAFRPDVKSKWAYIDTGVISGVMVELIQKPYE